MKQLFFSIALFAATSLTSATLDATWRIATPAAEPSGVAAALENAARELAEGLFASTGLKLTVARGTHVPSPAIRLGAAAAQAAGFDTAALADWANVIAEKNGDIYIFGNDRAGRHAPHRRWSECILPTARGVARFLQTYGGVDWTLPGRAGRTVTHVAPPTVPSGFLSRETPRLIYSAGIPATSLMFNCANGIWGCGAFHTYGGHTYPVACPMDKYGQSHPEYFGLVKGKRQITGRPGQTILCISNPAVRQLILDELLRRFDAGAAVCELGQQDGFKMCQCAPCAAYLHPDVSEKIWLFHVDLAREIEKLRPGKIVQIISYGPTVEPPKTFRTFPSNVMIELTRSGDEHLAQWREYTVPQGFTVYTYFWGCYPLAGFTAKEPFAHLAAHARSFLAHGIRGIYRCGYGEAYGMEGPGYYVFNRTLLDPEADTDRLVAEYCDKSFGPAGPEMTRFYRTLDAQIAIYKEAYRRYVAANRNVEGDFSFETYDDTLGLVGGTYNAAVRAELAAHLRAARSTPGLTEAARQRLALVELECAYAGDLGAAAETMRAYRANPCEATAQPLAAVIARRNAFLDKLYAGGNIPKSLPGWPELQLFRNYARSYLQANGRSGAAIGAPLDWDPVNLTNMYAVASWRAYDAAHTNRQAVTTWITHAGRTPPGISAGGRRLHLSDASSSTNAIHWAEHRFDKEWRPGTRVRVSWYAKVRGAHRRVRGGSAKATVTYGPGKEDYVRLFIPEMRTPDTDWVRQNIDITVPADSAAHCRLRFQLWQVDGDVWIEDVAWETR